MGTMFVGQEHNSTSGCAVKPKFKAGDKVRVCKGIAERGDNYGFFSLGMGRYQGYF